MVRKSILIQGLAVAVIATAAYSFMGCQPHEGSEDQLKADVDSFATLYFNWHFPKAIKYCTPESEKWLRYAASNVHEADVEALREKPDDAAIEIQGINFGDDEVTATVNISVTHFLQMDTIGKVAHLIDQASFQVPMEIHEGKWKVKLEALPH